MSTEYYVFKVDSGFQYEEDDDRSPGYYTFVERLTDYVNSMDEDEDSSNFLFRNPRTTHDPVKLYVSVSRIEGPFSAESEANAYRKGYIAGVGETYFINDIVVIGVNVRAH